MSSAAAGRPNRKPWPISQPSPRRTRSCSWVSMPSATIGRPSESAQRDDRAGERPGFGSSDRRAGDQLAGDLEAVDREPAQVGERGVARPEVVHRDPDAELAQASRVAIVAWASRNIAVSVISRVSARGSMPASRSRR